MKCKKVNRKELDRFKQKNKTNPPTLCFLSKKEGKKFTWGKILQSLETLDKHKKEINYILKQ